MVASLAIAAASAAAANDQQRHAANQAEDSARAANDVNLQAYATQQHQIDAQASVDMSERARQAMIQRGKLRVLGAESGIDGNSSDQAERQSQFDQSFDMAAIEGHRNALQSQAYLDAKGGVAATNSTLNRIQQPSLIGTGLRIATDGLDAKSAYDKKNPSSGASDVYVPESRPGQFSTYNPQYG